MMASYGMNESRKQEKGKSLLTEKAHNILICHFLRNIWWEAVYCLADSHAFNDWSIGIRKRMQLYVTHAKGPCIYFMVTY